MEDFQIIELYFARDEAAILKTGDDSIFLAPVLMILNPPNLLQLGRWLKYQRM